MSTVDKTRIEELEAALQVQVEATQAAEARANKAGGQNRVTVGEKGQICYKGGMGVNEGLKAYAESWVRCLTELIGENYVDSFGGTEAGGTLMRFIRDGIGKDEDGNVERDEKGHCVGNAAHSARRAEGKVRGDKYRARQPRKAA